MQPKKSIGAGKFDGVVKAGQISDDVVTAEQTSADSKDVAPRRRISD